MCEGCRLCTKAGGGGGGGCAKMHWRGGVMNESGKEDKIRERGDLV